MSTLVQDPSDRIALDKRTQEKGRSPGNTLITFEACWLGCIPGAVIATADCLVSKESVSFITAELYTGAKG